MKAKGRLMVLLSVPVLALVSGNPAYAAATKKLQQIWSKSPRMPMSSAIPW